LPARTKPVPPSSTDPARPQICPLSLHDALPISAHPTRMGGRPQSRDAPAALYHVLILQAPRPESASNRNLKLAAAEAAARPVQPDRKSTRLNSSHVKTSYAVFCLKQKNRQQAMP